MDSHSLIKGSPGADRSACPARGSRSPRPRRWASAVRPSWGDGGQHGRLVRLHQRDLDLVQHLERLDLGQIEALGDDPGVEALLDVGGGLLEELPVVPSPVMLS